MANLKADSPLCRRIVESFLDFLNSVEPTSPGHVESLEVAKDCLSEAFKIDLSSTTSVAKSDFLAKIFSSQTGENGSKSDQSLGDVDKRDAHSIGIIEDELFGQFFGALEKVHYFGTTENGDDEQALDRASRLFHNALMEMKQSGCEEFDLKNLADTFKLQGNKDMQSKLYSEAIELYTVAIALCDDNAIYYCNRAAALTQTNKHTEAIRDCNKAIAIDPSYSKAYSRLGYSYYAQGNYKDAIDKGFKKALQLDPNNESLRGNIRAAEQKLREEQQRAGRGQNSSSTSRSNEGHGSRGVPPFPFPSRNVDVHPFAVFREPSQQGMADEAEGIRVEQVDEMPAELVGTLRTVMQMFSDGTATPTPSQVNSQHNSNGNSN